MGNQRGSASGGLMTRQCVYQLVAFGTDYLTACSQRQVHTITVYPTIEMAEKRIEKFRAHLVRYKMMLDDDTLVIKIKALELIDDNAE